MQSAKEQCERYLEHMRSPLGIIFFLIQHKKNYFCSDVSLENYVTRNGRKAIDNVDDEAERELKKVYNSLNLTKTKPFPLRKFMLSMVLNDNFINKFKLLLIK
jgi:hypothetical protein